MDHVVIDPVQHCLALAEITPLGSVWRHRKGHEYKVTGHCTLEATVEAAVMYQRVEGDGPVWARVGHEFCDGRFTRLHERETD